MEALIPLILGAILPPVIDVVNKYVPSSNMRFLISVLFAIVVGGAMAYFEFGMEGLLANAGLIFVSAQTVYKMWYDHSKLQDKVRG